MAISDTQKVDYLWKKIGYAATKTDTAANKDATNEALPSPLQIRGDSLLVQSSSIPSSIPATTTSIVSVYRPDATLEMPLTAIGTNGPGQRGQLGSATAYRTWQTGLQNWISPEFGATYSVRVFLDTPGRTTSNTTGTELFATASNEEWFFDYQSGVLNFSGANLPSGISTKSVYISGARYTGEIGIANTVNTGAAAFAQANAAFAAANAAGSSTFVLWAANNSNSAFETANGAVAVNTTQNNSITVALDTSNAAFVHANAAFTAANNATDTYVRNHANAAFDTANGAVAVNTTQNNSITVALDTANAAFANANSYITYNEAVNVTQNNSIASAFIHANAAFASANNIDGVNTTQNNSITAAFAAANAATATDVTQNNSITVALDTANAAFANANSYITYNEAVNVTQNNSIAASFDTANGAVAVNLTQNNSIAAAFVHANAAFASANNIDAVNVTQNNSIASAFVHANSAFANANSYITYNEAVSVTQNNSITVALNTANAAFTRANNSLDANNGGSVSGTILSTANVRAVYVVANSGFTSAAGGSKLELTDIGLVTVDVASQQFKFGASGIESSPGIYGGSFGGNKLSLSNETNLISNRYDVVKIQTGTDGTTPNEFVFSNNSLTVPGGITANGFTAGGINVVPTLASSFNTANAAFSAANAATATDTTQNNSISAAFIRANNSLDANNGGTISGDIIITGNLTANIVGGTF